MNRPWKLTEDDVLSTLQDVVSIESVNPDLPGGIRGEVGMVDYLSQFFTAVGIPFETHHVLPDATTLLIKRLSKDEVYDLDLSERS